MAALLPRLGWATRVRHIHPIDVNATLTCWDLPATDLDSDALPNVTSSPKVRNRNQIWTTNAST
jgi:hypothetical protein